MLGRMEDRGFTVMLHILHTDLFMVQTLRVSGPLPGFASSVLAVRLQDRPSSSIGSVQHYGKGSKKLYDALSSLSSAHMPTSVHSFRAHKLL